MGILGPTSCYSSVLNSLTLYCASLPSLLGRIACTAKCGILLLVLSFVCVCLCVKHNELCRNGKRRHKTPFEEDRLAWAVGSLEPRIKKVHIVVT